MKKIFILSALCSLMGLSKAVAQEAYAVLTLGDSTLTFYYDNLKSSRSGNVFNLNSGDYDPLWMQSPYRTQIKTVSFDASFKSYQPTTTHAWFQGVYVTDIKNLRNLDTRNVTDMSKMFYGCRIAELDLSSLNTEKVTTMKYMFYGCERLKSLKLGSSFKTDNVTNMYAMFQGCKVLERLDLRYFNTQKVEDMSSMFYNCKYLYTLDLSSFDTRNMRNMQSMFGECSYLRTIYVSSSWNVSKVNQGYTRNMFSNCSNLKGGKGTIFDEKHVDKEYAHIDGGTGNPGYFTEIQYYDLTVCGTRVSNGNKDDILGDGSCSYDPTRRSLSFTKSVLASQALVENNVEDLSVWIAEDLSLLGYGIVSHKNLTLAHSATLPPVKLQIFSGNYNSIDIRDGATLTVNNLNLETNSSIVGNGTGKLVVNNTATVTASASGGAIQGFGGGITLNDRSINTPAGATVKDGTVVDSEGNAATKVVIGAKVVNLRVAGVGVTSSNQADILGDGAASYDPATNTLTLKGSIHGNDKQGIWSNLANLTILLATKDAMVTSTGSAAMVLRGNTTIKGPGFLSVRSTSSTAILVSQGATLTVEDITLDVMTTSSVSDGISGYEYSSKEKLVIRNAAVEVTSGDYNTSGAIVAFHGGITLEGCAIMEPQGGKFATNSDGTPYRIVDKDGYLAKTVKIGRSYGLWIAGRRVTDVNRYDILGDGAFQYDPDENVLHLKKDYMESAPEDGEVFYMSAPEKNPVVKSNIEGLTVSVDGDIKISAYSDVFQLYGDNTIITGPGKLTMQEYVWHYRVARNPYDANPIDYYDFFYSIRFSKGTLTIEKANITVTGGNSGGIDGYTNTGTSSLIIKDSYLNLETYEDYTGGVSVTTYNSAGDITLEGCKIVKPAGGMVKDGKIVDSEGKLAYTVIIGNPADVNRDGTVDSADIVAVIKEMPDGDKKADVNGDTVIDSADIVAVIKAMK